MSEIENRLQGRLLNIFLGSMLGDGHIRHRNRTPSFVEGHAVNQERYLRWKMSFWESKGLVSSESHRPKMKDSHQDSFSFQTKVMPELLPWREAFYDRHYPIGKKGRRSKHFPEEVVPLITPLGLAVWYMDDGGVIHNPFLSSHPRNHKVGQAILAEFGLESRITGGGDSWRIDVLDVEHFLSIIRPHMRQELAYKLLPPALGEHVRIPTDEFLYLVKEEKLSVAQLSEHFGFSPRTIESKADYLQVSVSRRTHIPADLASLVQRVPRKGISGRRVKQLPKDILGDLLLAGHSVRRISLRFGISENIVKREIERHGLDYKDKRGGNRPRYPHITEKALSEACTKCQTVRDLQRYFHCGQKAIQNRLIKWDLSPGR